KQTESRTINFVTFNANPSSSDTLDAKNRLLAQKEQFDTTANLEQFLLSEGVDQRLNYDGYRTLGAIQSSVKDSIVKMPVGSVYGPYLEGANFMLARLDGAREMSD